MKERSWMSFISAGLALVALLATYSAELGQLLAASVSVTGPKRWLLWLTPYAWEVGLACGVLLIVIQLIQGITAGPVYRKQTIQAALDALAEGCPGRNRENRITLFKEVYGWWVWCAAIRRHGLGLWRSEMHHKLAALKQVRLSGRYLYAYVRSSESRHPRSIAAFRVSDRREQCEGMAGLAWDDGWVCVPNLPVIKDEDRHRIQRSTVDEILQLPANTRLRRYVEATGIRSTAQLRAINNFARHFMGHEIRRAGGERWGVLLLDSEREECPFTPEDSKGGSFGAQFRTQALVLGNLVR